MRKRLERKRKKYFTYYRLNLCNAATKVKKYREMENLIGDEEKWITHYCSSHLILLVGEGDFSFAACLARAFGSGANMVATSLDSRESLLRKYSLAKGYLEELKLLGCSIFHEVDVAFMSRQPPLRFMCFDRIVFNFPHAGFYFRERIDHQIRLHRDLVTEFLRNAKEMLSENGEIHITHKTAHPYSRWEIVKLAEEVGLYLVRNSSENPALSCSETSRLFTHGIIFWIHENFLCAMNNHRLRSIDLLSFVRHFSGTMAETVEHGSFFYMKLDSRWFDWKQRHEKFLHFFFKIG